MTPTIRRTERGGSAQLFNHHKISISVVVFSSGHICGSTWIIRPLLLKTQGICVFFSLFFIKRRLLRVKIFLGNLNNREQRYSDRVKYFILCKCWTKQKRFTQNKIPLKIKIVYKHINYGAYGTNQNIVSFFAVK